MYIYDIHIFGIYCTYKCRTQKLITTWTVWTKRFFNARIKFIHYSQCTGLKDNYRYAQKLSVEVKTIFLFKHCYTNIMNITEKRDIFGANMQI